MRIPTIYCTELPDEIDRFVKEITKKCKMGKEME
jgi:hypothetical protein